jgi:GNAT superfamily N-acetyltransferase
MTIKETDGLTLGQMKSITTLWNNEYPKQLEHEDLNAFRIYLNSLLDKRYLLCLLEDGSIGAWYCDFMRGGERWFAMLVDASIQQKGIGSKLLAQAKQTQAELNGWVIDHEREVKANGQPYISPLAFYKKHGFEVLSNHRLELEKISAVKIRWKKE